MFGAYRNIVSNDMQQLFVKSVPSYTLHVEHISICEKKVCTNIRPKSKPVLGVK